MKICRYSRCAFGFFSLITLATTAYADDLSEQFLLQLDRENIVGQVCQEASTADAQASSCAFGYCSDNGDIPVTVNPGREIVCNFPCNDIAKKAACAKQMVDSFFNPGDARPSCSGWCFSSSNTCTLTGALGGGGVDIDIVYLDSSHTQCAYQYGNPYGHPGTIRASCSCESVGRRVGGSVKIGVRPDFRELQ